MKPEAIQLEAQYRESEPSLSGTPLRLFLEAQRIHANRTPEDEGDDFTFAEILAILEQDQEVREWEEEHERLHQGPREKVDESEIPL